MKWKEQHIIWHKFLLIGTLLLCVLPILASTTVEQYQCHKDYEELQAEPYVWTKFHGRSYSEPGLYIDTLISGQDTTIGQLLLSVDYTQSVWACIDQVVDSITTPWGTFPFDSCECLTGCLIQTEDSMCIVSAVLCIQRYQPVYDTLDITIPYDTLQTKGFEWFNERRDTAGIYQDTLFGAAANGCDSIGTLILRTTYYDSLYVCKEDTAVFTTPWGEYGLKKDCDCMEGWIRKTADNTDLVWAKLCAIRLYTDTLYQDTTLCYGDTIDWHGLRVFETTTYEARDSFLRLPTCDSMVYYLNATITSEPQSISADSTICQGDTILWHNQTITTTGLYYDTARIDIGFGRQCDSIWYTMDVTVNLPTKGDTTAYVCFYDLPYIWHGEIAQDSAIWHTTNAAGCDSTVYLHLVVSPEPQTHDADTAICYGDMIEWHQQQITMAGTYYDTARVTMGNGTKCDSIWYTLNVTVNMPTNGDTTAYICYADLPYIWHGKEATDGDTIIRRNVVGCDSIVTIHLFVSAAPVEIPLHDTASCQLVPFLWHGHLIASDTICYDTIRTTKLGCDSIYASLQFTLIPPTKGDTTAYVCFSDLPYIWHGKEVVDGDTIIRRNAAGCDSIVTLHLVVSPEPQTHDADSAICQGDMIEWHQQQISAAGIYYDTARITMGNGMQCDSIWYSLSVTVHQPTYGDTTAVAAKAFTWYGTTYTTSGDYIHTLVNTAGCDSIVTLHLTILDVCQPLQATIQVPNICADARTMDIIVQLDSGAIIGYTVHYQNAIGNTMPFRDTTIYISPIQAQEEPVLLSLPVPYDPANRQRYPRPDEYRMQLTLYGSCPDTLAFDTTTFQVYYPSWILDQHWDDVIALLNDRYNGGYTFSKVEWLRDGEVLLGEDNLYIYLPHQLWTNPEHQYQSYFYQASLTRTDDGKTILTCPIEPEHIDSTNVLTEPYVAVTPTLVPKENPVVHIQTNTTGTYWLYSATGKLLQTADYEPCEHDVFDILLPYQTQTMYILVFTPRNDPKPLQHKYRVVKLLLE